MAENNKDIRKREQLAREIEKTSDAIRKKHRALKTGRIEEEIAMERRFKPIVAPLKQIVEESQPIKRKEEIKEERIIKKRTSDDGASYELSKATSSKKQRFEQAYDAMDSPAITSTPRTMIGPATLTNKALEDVFETTDDSFGTSVQHQMQTLEGRKTLSEHFGPLGQKYIGDFFSGGGKEKIIDTVYGVRLDKDGMMLGNKKFDMDINDNIIIDGVRYAGTPGLYELIFKRLPDDFLYKEDDLQKYKSILLTTNVHRKNYTAESRLRGNKGYKYKYVIAPLMSIESTPKRKNKSGKGLPRAMILNDNKIDYVHWDDPNELVDRLRLLDASHRAGNDAHGNEMLSIVEELREAGIIIN